jgi:biotin--protein ligase
MKKILIYQGAGADAFGIKALNFALNLEGIDNRYRIELVNKDLMGTANWIKDTDLLIFPGGRDIPYHQALQGVPNQHIQDYVQQGGNYFGICAGGYYGCANIEFEKGCPLEVIADRDLKFYPGIARGPAYGNGKFCYRGQRGAQIALLKLSLQLSSPGASAAYYNGGCAFMKVENHPNTEVLGRYSDIEGEPAAIVQCRVGIGKALLCGVHPEYSALNIVSSHSFTEKQLAELLSIEHQRRQLFADLLRSVGLEF